MTTRNAKAVLIILIAATSTLCRAGLDSLFYQPDDTEYTTPEQDGYRYVKKLLAAAREPKELWTIEGGRHTEALGKYRRIFTLRLYKLFTSWINE